VKTLQFLAEMNPHYSDAFKRKANKLINRLNKEKEDVAAVTNEPQCVIQ
jgi:hypothetical protein